MHTPDHMPTDIAYKIFDAVFVNDRLFMADYGTAGAAAEDPAVHHVLGLQCVGLRYIYAWEISVQVDSHDNLHLCGGVNR